MGLYGYKLRQSVTCKCCGKKIWDYRIMFARMKEKPMQNGICPECQRWNNIIRHPPKEMEIIDGSAYMFGRVQKREIGVTLGGKGKTRCIARKDGTGFVSNDVWLIGKIPDTFKNKLPNTAWWIEEHNGRRLALTKMKCKNKSCYDRYHCFRYDYRIEFDKGPYNSIPKDWITGNERCRYFVNILTIQNYFDYFDTSDPLLYENPTQ